MNQHTAIPKTNADLISDPSQQNGVGIHTQAIAFTAGFHFAFIEQSGNSLYPSLAQRLTNPEVLRILLSIGPTETMHFQTWQDKAGNATQITDTDTGFPGATGVTVAFPNLNAGLDPNDPGQTTPSPSVADQFFLSRKFPQVSIIRPTETENAAKGALKGLIDDGLFIGHTSKSGKSDGLLELLTDLAEDADDATRGA